MIVVFGSINLDLTLRLPALPAPGETVLCPGYAAAPGGKGANQAVAAARAGRKTIMVGRVGDDMFADHALAALRAAGVDVTRVATGAAPTGLAFICVDDSGNNMIAVASGANLRVGADQVAEDLLAVDSLLVMQMEVAPAQNWALCRRARAAGARVVLNAAPAGAIPRHALDQIDTLVVNQGEWRAVAHDLGVSQEIRTSGRQVAADHGLALIVTLGEAGAVAVSRDQAWRIPPLAITPVDTTGAGDAFVGALAAALDQGLALIDALPRASTAAALACLTPGAQPSIPDAAAIARALPRQPPPVPL